ncbi:MAG: DUF1549 domain-containing protein, partial [Planctomycetales bacterium]|nr:DUF1549 domain-containing protein [Planctomycetales bacterium]
MGETVKRAASTFVLFWAWSFVVDAAPVDFVRDVRPIFVKHCYSCHADKKQKSGFRLDVRSAAFAGGDLYGESIIRHQAAESPLVQFVADPDADLRMPPEGETLSSQEIETLTRWVNEGAVWPDGVDLVQLKDRRDHWSFKPLSHAPPPQTRDSDWSRSDVDRFVLARLESEGLAPAPPAERRVWLRRVALDLTGLPPTPDQVAAFLADDRQGAYERVVNRLLASPHYGERWAQHWLDVVRYADTHG